jgi:glycosyltransferase involved in cell wall biosynthesis
MGPAQALTQLAEEQSRQGLKVTIVTVDDPAGSGVFADALRAHGVAVHCTGPGRGPFFKGPTTRATVRQALEQGQDVVHIHGLWEYMTNCAAPEARRANVPYIVQSDGMLEPHALAQRRLRKAVHLFFKGRRDLRRAAAIRTTAALEARNVQRLDLRVPVLVIPLGIAVDEFSTTPQRAEVDARWPALTGKRLMLFLGRIDPIKGTAFLAQAWGRLSREFPDWRLVIAGPDWRGHQAEFEGDLRTHGGLDSTVFVGPVYGQAKAALLASSDAFVQPSFQENFGITIAESMASARPVITTRGTPWKVLESCKLGWWVDVGADPLYQAMRDAMRRPRAELDDMGRRARALMEKDFTWPVITSRLTDAYEWVRGAAPQPADAYRPDQAVTE